MQEIKLTRGQVTLVDDEDYEWLNQWKWFSADAKKGFYAARDEVLHGKTKRILMHRLLMKTPDDMQTDHRDHDGLNNQKYNLRVCTYNQNNYNSGERKRKSRFKGVEIRYHRFRARIGVDGRDITIGSFGTDKEAAIAYNNAAIKYFGEFANLNKID